MKSLIVLALPRSLSSLVYSLAQRSLGLMEPVWTTDGEILNNDRHVLFRGDRHESGLKYVQRSRDPHAFVRVMAFLSQVTQGEGFAYKDVVQPFVFAEWPALSKFRLLIVRRPLADIADCVLRQGWTYPGLIFADRSVSDPNSFPRRTDILRGLLVAQKTLQGLPGEHLDYDDIVASEQALHAALARLYPDTWFTVPYYIDQNFMARRDELMARRQTGEYQALAAEIAELEESTP